MSGLKYLRNVTTLELSPEKCTGCATCLEVCPQGVLALVEDKVQIVDQDACMECGACARNCPEGAIHVRAGVGCAAAILAGAVGGGSACCCPRPSAAGPPDDSGQRPGCCE